MKNNNCSVLYCSVMYALAHSNIRKATILYPTIDPSAKEARIDIADPASRAKLGSVQLRPVNLLELAGLINLPNSASLKREKQSFARYLVYRDDYYHQL